MGPFDPKKKVIEYLLEDESSAELVSKTLTGFANETASESPAPGGGSIAAYVGALGVSLGTMVANLSAHKKGWDDKWEQFSYWAEQGQKLKNRLLFLVDEDTRSFNKIIDAIRLPKASDEEKATRGKAITKATKYAIEVPFQVMQTAFESFDLLEEMARNGNPNSVSDAGVGALCAKTAVEGAFLNVIINCKDLKDGSFVDEITDKAKKLLENATNKEREIMNLVLDKIK